MQRKRYISCAAHINIVKGAAAYQEMGSGCFMRRYCKSVAGIVGDQRSAFVTRKMQFVLKRYSTRSSESLLLFLQPEEKLWEYASFSVRVSGFFVCLVYGTCISF